jgi:hypothetical protein
MPPKHEPQHSRDITGGKLFKHYVFNRAGKKFQTMRITRRSVAKRDEKVDGAQVIPRAINH